MSAEGPTPIPLDWEVRTEVYRGFAEDGSPPSLAALAATLQEIRDAGVDIVAGAFFSTT